MLQMYLPLFQKSLSPSRTLSPNTSRVIAFTGPCLLCTCNDKAGLIFLSAESHLSSLFSGCVFFYEFLQSQYKVVSEFDYRSL